MKKEELVQNYLNELFPDATCELNFNNNFELLIAVILSAQCTDKRVNIVTKELFKVCKTPQDILNLGLEKLKVIIHSCGFYNNKGKNIISLCEDLVNKYNGEVPSKREDLENLKGVGRKTANVVLAVAFGEDAFAVDTHVFRVSRRLGLTNENTPSKVEKDLCKIFPKSSWSKLHYQMVLFGRYHCKAIKPICENCKLRSICTKLRLE